jgi:hypothetical protein
MEIPGVDQSLKFFYSIDKAIKNKNNPMVLYFESRLTEGQRSNLNSQIGIKMAAAFLKEEDFSNQSPQF